MPEVGFRIESARELVEEPPYKRTQQQAATIDLEVRASRVNRTLFRLLIFILLVMGHIVLFLTYYSASALNFSNERFWLGMLLSGSATFLILHSKSFGLSYKLLSLFNWVGALYLPQILASPYFVTHPDELSQYQAYFLIKENASLNVSPTISPLRIQYPSFPLLTIILSHVTSLSFIIIGRVAVLLIITLVVLLIFMISKLVVKSERIAFLIAFLFPVSPTFLSIGVMLDYKSLGLLFFILSVYVLVKEKMKYQAIWLVVALTLALTHALSSCSLLLFYFILLLQNYKKNKRMGICTTHMRMFFYAFSVVLIWTAYAGFTILKSAFTALRILKEEICSLRVLELFGKKRFIQASLSPFYEQFFIVLYFPTVLILSTIGWHLSRKDSNLGSGEVFKTFLIFGPCLFLFSLYFVFTYGTSEAMRSWLYIFSGVSIITGYSIGKLLFIINSHNRNLAHLISKVAVMVALIILVVGGISLGLPVANRTLPSSSYLASGRSSMTVSVFKSAEWFQEFQGRYNHICGDLLVQSVFGEYGVQNVHVQDISVWRLFYPRVVDEEVLNFIHSYSFVRYIIVDERISKLLAYHRSYFQLELLVVKGYPIYGYEEPLPIDSLRKFNYIINFVRIYDNGDIEIFENSIGY